MTDLPKAYTPSDVEGAIYERWLAADVFAPDGAGSTADPDLPPFTIIQPPPNVTGSLHLGHAQRTAVEDLLIRHARMRGHRTLFLPGLDHASIAAQFVLDGILAKEGESRQSLGRERYLERMRAFSDSTRPVMLANSGGSARRPTGAGCATRWTRAPRGPSASRSNGCIATASPTAPRRSSTGVPGCRTSVSDLEVVSTPETGTLWSVRYHLIDDATGRARPGRDHHRRHDTARDDPRRRRGGGPSRRCPLPRPGRATGADPVRRARRADHRGRGRRAVVRHRCREDHPGARPGGPRDRQAPRTAGADDPRRRRHDREHRDARSTGSTATRPASGSWPSSPRAAISSTRAPHEMIIGRCQRSNDVLEPRLKTQWFIRTGPLAARALDATRSGRTRILPERFDKTWEHWLTSIRDWNVSRQLWWGHRIPAWYCPDGHVTVSSEPDGPPACETCGRPAGGAQAGPGHLRHVVQLGAVAVLDARLARRHGRLSDLLPDVGHGDRLRHHLLLGRPDDDARAAPHRPRAVPHDLPLRADPRPRRPEDVEDEGQRRRSARRHRRDRCRRPALRGDPWHRRRPGPAVRRGPSSRTPATSPTSCGTRPGSWSAPGRRRIAAGAERRLPYGCRPRPGRALDPVARERDGRGRRRGDGRLRLRRGDPASCTTRSGTSSATGASSSPRSAWPTSRSPAETREATWWALVEALDTYLRLLHPVMPFVTEALWEAIPHRASDPGAADRGPLARRRPVATTAVEAEVGAILELIRGLRNARAEAQRRGRRPGCRPRSSCRRRWVRPSRRCDRRSSGSRAPGRSSDG